MPCFSLKMISGPLPPFIGSNVSSSVKPPCRLPSLQVQVKVKEVQRIEVSEKKSVNISRRDLALFLTTTSFSVVTLSSPKPAEAVMSRVEMKKTILEKLKILREKAGLSKPETEEKEKTETMKNDKSASPAPLTADKKTPMLPKIHNDKKIVVEAAPLP